MVEKLRACDASARIAHARQAAPTLCHSGRGASAVIVAHNAPVRIHVEYHAVMDEWTSDAETTAPTTPGNASVAPVGDKILIIDDTVTIVAYIRHVLLRLGYDNIIAAYDGVTGLQQFYQERPDCVIIDVVMPGLDGYQVVRSIRGDSSAADTPLIIVSALQQPDQRLTGLLSGVDEYLAKPFKPSTLAAAIDRVMHITPEERARRMERLASDEPPNG